jgi:trehalose 6-phosphate phosphatase
VIAPASDGGVTRAVEAAAAPLIAEYPELLLERKSAAVALHYRLRPELEAECIDTVERAVAGLSDVEVKRGKMVIEAKEGTHDKGDAVAEYLNERPFFGRRPVFAGDDVTDEDAFAIVNARGGISIKIGAGATRATYRAAGTTEFLAWLQRTAQAFGRPVDH